MNQASIHRVQMAFGRALRKFRIETGLTQEKLGELAGVHRNYVGDVERAEENVSLITILRLCDALEISLADLVEEIDAQDSELRVSRKTRKATDRKRR